MITLEEQQKIASEKLNQPLELVKKAGFVDEKTGIFCVFVATDKTGRLLIGDKLKGYRGGHTLLVGQDGGVLSGGSALSVEQLLEKYLAGERKK